MGNKQSGRYFNPSIGDNFETREQLTDALRKAGLEQANLLVAIDFTKSNTWQGEKTFGGASLHHLGQAYSQVLPPPVYNAQPTAPDWTPQKGHYTYVEPENEFAPPSRKQSIGRALTFNNAAEVKEAKSLIRKLNPYQYTLSVGGNQLEAFDDDKWIPTCIFGHGRSKSDPYVKDISPTEKGCFKIDGVIEAYENAVRTHGLSGDTFFTPVLDWAEAIVRQTMEYHILLIIGDGCINDMEETKAKLEKLSEVPLSIVFVGVGDGSDPDNEKDKWKKMRELDQRKTKKIDNWQSVYLANMRNRLDESAHPDLDFALWMFMEIPEQYKYFKKNILDKQKRK